MNMGDEPYFWQEMIRRSLRKDAFASEVTITPVPLFEMKVADERLHRAVRDFLSVVSEYESPLVQVTRGHQTPQEHIYFTDTPEPDAAHLEKAIVLQQPLFEQYLKYHVLGQRLSESKPGLRGGGTNVKPEYVLNDRDMSDGRYVLQALFPYHPEKTAPLARVIETMLIHGGLRGVAAKVRLWKEDRNGIAVQTGPKEQRILIELQPAALAWVHGLSDEEFRTRFQEAKAKASSRGI